jgi:hypothetical protein
MDNETDVTREQMDETRASMSEKMETLEQRVVDTVHGAAETVTHTVANVKDAVHATVENVKDTVDVRLQMTRHPWTMVGGCIALGFLGGYLLFRHTAAQPSASGMSRPAFPDRPRITEQPNGVAKDFRIPEQAFGKRPVPDVAPSVGDPGWLERLHTRFGSQMDTVKGLAIGAALGVARDMITQSSPEVMKAALVDVIDGLTVRMGGEPLHGPVLNGGPHAAGERPNESYSSSMEQRGTAPQESEVRISDS